MTGKALTKSQTLEAIAEANGVTKKEATSWLENFVNLSYSEVKRCGEFTFPGLGKLQKKDRSARMGRNPATGESINIPAKTVLKFRVSKAAKDEIL